MPMPMPTRACKVGLGRWLDRATISNVHQHLLLLLAINSLSRPISAVHEGHFRDWAPERYVGRAICASEVGGQAWRQMTFDYVPNPYRHGSQAFRYEVQRNPSDGSFLRLPEDGVTFGCPARIPYWFNCAMAAQTYAGGVWSPCAKVYGAPVPDEACVAQGKAILTATLPRTREREVLAYAQDVKGNAVMGGPAAYGCPIQQSTYEDCGPEQYYPFTPYCFPAKTPFVPDPACIAAVEARTLTLGPKMFPVIVSALDPVTQVPLLVDGTSDCAVQRESYYQCMQYKEFQVNCQDVLGDPFPDPGCGKVKASL
jgi:hypothetical protein